MNDPVSAGPLSRSLSPPTVGPSLANVKPSRVDGESPDAKAFEQELSDQQQRSKNSAIGLGRPGDKKVTDQATPSRRLPVIDRSKVDPQMLKAAQGMEAMFLDYMMKTMRQTVPKNEFDLESPATEIYRNMMDTETAQRAASNGGVGLADQLIAYLDAQRYTLPMGHGAPKTKAELGSHDGTPDQPSSTGR